MRLISLSLKNFKGIKNFTLESDGNSTDIYGENATGKTTIQDAFSWLLFNKDSQDRTVFEIKTIDQKSGEARHNLEHEVSATIFTDRPVTLRKVYSEKWTKRRGSVSPEFTGHTTEHFVDEVPTPKGEYQAFINSIAPEETFQLLTDPRHFSENMHWQKRREMLFAAFGDVSDQEVIDSKKALKSLPDVLNGRSIEDHRKIIAARRTAINKELDKIPVRIDEASRNLPDISGLDKTELNASLKVLAENIHKAKNEKARIETGGEIAELQKQLAILESQHIAAENAQAAKQAAKQAEKRGPLAGQRAAFLRESDKYEDKINRLTRQQAQIESDINTKNDTLDRLRAEWLEFKNKDLLVDIREVCPTCGQALPSGQVQAARDKAVADFNERKAIRLGANVSAGKSTAQAITKLKASLADMQVEIEKLQAKKAKSDEAAENLRLEIEGLAAAEITIAPPPEIADLKTKIAELEAGHKAPLEKIDGEISFLENSKRELGALLQSIKTHASGQARIKELEAEQKTLAAEFEKLESELFLTDEFVRAKVGILEKKINSQFQITRFKLFNTQVNGGIEECCEIVHNGVPYSSMNNAARINCGLDIINTLSGVYDFSAPIFCDNAEAVTDLFPINAQVIRLIVSAQDKKLRIVTYTPKKAAEAA